MPLPNAVVERMLAEYAAGKTYREIAEAHGLQYDQVRRTLVKLAPSRRSGPRELPASTPLIVSLRDVSELSWPEIGRQVGMSKEGAKARYHKAKGTFRR